MKSCSRIAALLMTVAFFSCSVLEDREECPCRIVLFSDMCGAETSLTMWRRTDVMLAVSAVADDSGKILESDVKRGLNRICAVCSRSMGNAGEESFIIPSGCQCDSVYACTAQMDCRGDMLVDTVAMHKQFASLRIHFADPDFIRERYRILAVSGSCGFAIPYLTPVEGEFEYEIFMDDDAVGHCRLPRQADDSVHIVLRRKDDNVAEYRFYVGKAMKEAGYNWGEEDLRDMDVWLDYSNQSGTVAVHDWETEELGNVRY